MHSFSTRAWYEWLLLRLHVVWWTGAAVGPGMFQAHVLMVLEVGSYRRLRVAGS